MLLQLGGRQRTDPRGRCCRGRHPGLRRPPGTRGGATRPVASTSRGGDPLVGAAVVAVDAEVLGSSSDVLARLDAWFVDGHHLRRDRLRDGWGGGPSAGESSDAPSARCASRPVKDAWDGYIAWASVPAIREPGRRWCASRSISRGPDVAPRPGTALVGMATASTIARAMTAGAVLIVATPIGLAAMVGAGEWRTLVGKRRRAGDRSCARRCQRGCRATRLRGGHRPPRRRQNPPFRRLRFVWFSCVGRVRAARALRRRSALSLVGPMPSHAVSSVGVVGRAMAMPRRCLSLMTM